MCLYCWQEMYKKREEMDEEEGLVIEDPGLGSKQCTYTWVCVLCVGVCFVRGLLCVYMYVDLLCVCVFCVCALVGVRVHECIRTLEPLHARSMLRGPQHTAHYPLIPLPLLPVPPPQNKNTHSRARRRAALQSAAGVICLLTASHLETAPPPPLGPIHLPAPPSLLLS